MQTVAASSPIRCPVSSTAGRGPCEACGVLAELNLVESWRPSLDRRARILGVLALCLPCGERPEPARAA